MSLPIYNKNSRPKWVFLDLDDTLWDFSANSLLALRELYNTYKYLCDHFGSFDQFADNYHRINARLWALYERAEISVNALKRDRFALLFPDIAGTPEGDSRGDELQLAYISSLGRQTILVPGALTLCRYLSKNYLLGILSNGFREVQYRKLYGSPLWRYIQRMILSDEIGITKPDPRLFHYAEAATGASADEILFVGDNPVADIRGALDAGWRAVYFDRAHRDNAPDGAITIHSLTDLMKIL